MLHFNLRPDFIALLLQNNRNYIGLVIIRILISRFFKRFSQNVSIRPTFGKSDEDKTRRRQTCDICHFKACELKNSKI